MRRPARPGFGQYAVYPPYSASLPGESGLGCGCSMRGLGYVPELYVPVPARRFDGYRGLGSTPTINAQGQGFALGIGVGLVAGLVLGAVVASQA